MLSIGSVRALGLMLALAAFSLAAPARARASCRPRSILVDEDEHFYYCAGPEDFPEAAANLVFAMDRAARLVNPTKSLDPAIQHLNCSAFFREVGRALGARTPEWTSEVQANDVARMIRTNPRDWRRVTGPEAEVTARVQQLANQGAVVVAVREGTPNGHLAIASPIPPGIDLSDFRGRGPMVRDGNVHLSGGRAEPSGWGAVRSSYAFSQPPDWYLWLPSTP